jgi:phosphate-selective porin OprO/OprP
MALLDGDTNECRADETNRLSALDQKVRILERRLEIADEVATARLKDSAVLTAGKDGFALASPDKAHVLKLRGYAQADGRFFLDDGPDSLADTFVVRRARAIVEGTLGKKFDFRVAPDFGGGKTELQDAYVDFRQSGLLNVRAGRTKVPFGIERLQSSSETLFNEAGMSTALTPNYDEGVMLFGCAVAGAVEYSMGVFNGGPDGASVDTDTNDGKDLAARLVVTPLRKTGLALLSGLSVGVAGTVGRQEGNASSPGLPSFRSAGQQTVFGYRTAPTPTDTAFADGDRTRLAPQMSWFAGPFGLMGEYVTSEQRVANGSGSDRLRNEAWQVAASWVVTGETPSLKGVRPGRPLNVADGAWGAVELAARVGGFATDDEAFDRGYADGKKAVSAAAGFGAGVNWYLTRNLRLTANWDRTEFKGGSAEGDRPTEQVVSLRAQAAW